MKKADFAKSPPPKISYPVADFDWSTVAAAASFDWKPGPYLGPSKKVSTPDTSGKPKTVFVVVENGDFGGCADLLEACQFNMLHDSYEFCFRLDVNGHDYRYQRHVGYGSELTQHLIDDVRQIALGEIFKLARKEGRL